MCGFIAVVDKKNTVNRPTMEKMCNRLIHRGPNASGCWINKDSTVGLAHRRLSIIDLSDKANQPMVSNDSRYVLVYNGEVYNYKQLRNELKENGFGFNTDSDTEVVLNALIFWQSDALIKLHGQFALAFYDNSRNYLLIARDRIGEKPLHYLYNSQVFACSSEIKALEEMDIFKKDIDETALIDYLTFGYVSAPKTIWKNIVKLEPGKYIEVDSGNSINVSAQKPYWKLVISPDKKLDFYETGEQFKCILKDVSRDMMVSDVPTGVFLSGGVDSSGVVAALGNQNISLNTYSIGFDDSLFNEIPYASKVSDIYKTRQTTRILHPDDMDTTFDKIVAHFDEPFNDFSFLPFFYISSEAVRNATVCLSGDGADEVFCGYVKYPKTKTLTAFNKFFPAYLRKPATILASAMLPDYSDYKRHVLRAGYSEEYFLFDMLAIAFKQKELLKIAGPYIRNILNNYSARSVINRHIKDCKAMNLDLINKLRYLDLKMTLPEDMLVKVDRVSMMNSLEVRPVYLHPRIVEFALKLPTHFLVDNGIGKLLLKKSFEQWLPKDILYRKKMGFGVPLTKWFLQDMNHVMEEGLAGLPEDWFVKSELKTLLQNHLKGKRDFIMQLHSLVFLGKWLKKKIN